MGVYVGAGPLRQRPWASAIPPLLPSQISGLMGWYRGDTGVFTDTGKTTPAVNDTDIVRCWADQSGQGNDATAPADLSSPILKLGANGIGGKASVLFDGTASILYANGLAPTLSGNDPPFTLMTVCRVVTATLTRSLLSGSNSTAAAASYQAMQALGGAGTKKIIRTDNTPTSANRTAGSPGVVNHCWIWTYTGTVAAVYTDGVQATSGALNVGATTLDQAALGGDQARDVTVEANYYSGHMADVALWNSALNSATINGLLSYVAQRYGLVVTYL